MKKQESGSLSRRLETMIAPVRQWAEAGSTFFSERKILLLFTVLVTVMTYGALLIHSGDILTDMETYVTDPAGFLTVYEQAGRFGMSLTKKLFSTDAYAPALFLSLMMVTMASAALVFDFHVSRIIDSQRKHFSEAFYFVFNGLFLSCPVLIHQFYFYYQSFEIAFGFLLGMGSAFLLTRWAYEKNSCWCLLGGLALLVWSIGTYQIFAPFSIAVHSICFLLLLIYGEPRERYDRIAWKIAAALLSGLVLYVIVSKLVVGIRYQLSETQFLADTYIGWGKLPASECLGNILGEFRRMGGHEHPAFNRFYGLLTAGAAVLLVVTMGQRRKNFWLAILAALVFFLSPYLLTILQGNHTILRAQMVYPFVFAATAGLVVLLLPKLLPVRVLALTFMAVLLFGQMDISNRYALLMHGVAESDRQYAQVFYREKQEILGEYGIYDGGAVPMVFIGKCSPKLPASYIQPWDALGLSFFEIDSNDLGGTNRIARMMNCLGLSTAETSVPQYEEACRQAESAPVWPRKGSIWYDEAMNMVVIHLSSREG